MIEKLHTLWPEIVILATAFVVMIIGLSPSAKVRRFTFWLSAISLVAAGYMILRGETFGLPALTPLAYFLKLAILGIGFLLLLAAAEVPDEAHADPADAKKFIPGLVSRGEFYGFFLLSLVGAMLCVGADDLIWLFLALELTSLPTYVMVSIARERIEAPEAGVKYFFLGAFAAAIFLYGFTLLYGATGTTMFVPFGGEAPQGAATINAYFASNEVSAIGMLGLLLSVVGICFKVAAVPMHAYVADVYQGAATPVTAFLAFVPKTAGFVAMLAILGLVGWPLGDAGYGGALYWLMWVLAVSTMFVGNTLALRQGNVKRVLAYSSIAHSGYMMVGLLVGPNVASAIGGETVSNGVAAVLFYLVAYGVMNLGAFAVLGILRSRGDDCETYDDLRGLVRRHPVLASIMAVCVFSLTGLPPILGFWGKVWLVGSAVSASEGVPSMIWLVVLTVLASAIGAVYYLRIIGACFLPEPNEATAASPTAAWRSVAALASAAGVIAFSLGANWLVDASYAAATGASAEPVKIVAPTESQPLKAVSAVIE